MFTISLVEDEVDLSTIEFIVTIVNETIGNYSSNQLDSLFGIIH